MLCVSKPINYNMPIDDVFTEDTWVLYYHDPSDSNWTTSGYKMVCTVTSALQFWYIQNMLSEHLKHSMWFIMRDGVFPLWDDPENIDGTCVSIKVSLDDAQTYWEELCGKCLCEHMCVNGISIAPKRGSCVIKFWLHEALGEQQKKDVNGLKTLLCIPERYQGEIVARDNREHILNNQKMIQTS